MYRLLLCLAALGAVLSLVTGCAGVAGVVAGNLIDDLINGDDDTPAVPTALQGTWRQTGGTQNGAAVAVTGTNTVKFNSNQTYRRERSNSAPAWEDGTLSVSGSTLTCRVTSCSDITRINTLTAIAYGISGSTLTLTWTEGGVVYTETFIRA